MAEILFVGGGGGGPPGGVDYFAPKYLVGNVLNGDSGVAYNVGGFQYIPDPGDGSGIALALTQPNGPGDVSIRPGTYTKTQGRFVVPAGVRVWGAGPTTIIIGSLIDNTIFELGQDAACSYMNLAHPGPIALVGTCVVNCVGSSTRMINVDVDVSAAAIGLGSILNAGILYEGPGSQAFHFSLLEQVSVLGPPGTGLDPLADPANIPLLFACVRGGPGVGGNSHIVSINVCSFGAGDVGILSVGTFGQDPQQGGNFMVARTLLVGPAITGFYFDNATLLTFHCVLLGFAATQVAGKVLLNSFQYEIASSFTLNLAGSPNLPAIIVSGPEAAEFQPAAGANIHDCIFLGWGGVTPTALFPLASGTPVIALGYGGQATVPFVDVVRSVRVHSNRFIGFDGSPVVPVYFDFGCTNSMAALNIGDGMGGQLPLDNGGGNSPNVNNMWT